MKKDIVIWPDNRLIQNSAPVIEFDATLHSLLKDLRDTLSGEDWGLGLAAPQIGINKRVILIEIPKDPAALEPMDLDLQNQLRYMELINPWIKECSNLSDFKGEGCLSLPGEKFDTKRFSSIEIVFQDRWGNTHSYKTDDLLIATELQHEIEHLDGKLLVSKLSLIKRDIIRRRMIKYKKFLEYKKALESKKLI